MSVFDKILPFKHKQVPVDPPVPEPPEVPSLPVIEVPETPRASTEAPIMPVGLGPQAEELPSLEETEIQMEKDAEIETEQQAEINALAEKLNAFYSALLRVNEDLRALCQGNINSNTEFFENSYHDALQSQRACDVVIAESPILSQRAVLVKRKLMFFHELHAENELLEQQSKLFTSLSDVHAQLNRVQDIVQLTRLSLIEFIEQRKQGAVAMGITRMQDEIQEIWRQTKQAVSIVAELSEQVAQLNKLDDELKEVTLNDTVHRNLKLEKEDMLRLSNIFAHVNTIFTVLAEQSKIRSLSPANVTKDAFLPFVSSLELRILPILQKCMRYEYAIFMAAKQVELQAFVNQAQTEALLNRQKEIRLFSATLRTLFRDLNTTHLKQLRDANTRINTSLATSREGTAISELAMRTNVHAIENAIADGIKAITAIQTKLENLHKFTYMLFEYMRKPESEELLTKRVNG